MIHKKKVLSALCKHVFLIAVMVVALFPFLWMFFASFKPEADIFAKDFHLLPREWHFENYSEAWNTAPFGKFFINTFSAAGITVLGQIFTCTMAAYAFAKINFRFKKGLFTLLLAAMLIPEEAAIVPNYLLAQKLHLTNSALGIALPSLTSVFSIFLVRQVFMQIPDDLLNAARLDGCGILKSFFHIALPSSKSSLATVALLAFLASWNSYMWPYMVTDQTAHRTLQIGLKYLIKPDLGPQWPMIMAASTLVMIPVLILFLVLQKYFVSGFVKSGLK